MLIVSSTSPRLFDTRISHATASLDQYAGTETELDPKQGLALFDRRIASERAVAKQYAGTDTELDPKPPALFGQSSEADLATVGQFNGSDAEIDPKPPGVLFRQKRDADPVTAAQYVGSDAEMDNKISDRRLKREIRRIGVSPSGLAIYSFRYVWGGSIYVGVMAQDLLATRPDAVIQTESGYLMVDYNKIDVQMARLDADHASQVAAEESSAFFAPALFARRRAADRVFGAQYVGVESEADVKTPTTSAAAQYVGTNTEMDVKPSDRRLKREIRRIGVSPSGVPIYSFRYVWGGPIYVGVMAQDLLATRPDAVIQSEGGYLMVDYDKIDVKMTSHSTPALFARPRTADKFFGAQYVGVESEADVKPPVIYAAARYVGTNTGIDVKSV